METVPQDGRADELKKEEGFQRSPIIATDYLPPDFFYEKEKKTSVLYNGGPQQVYMYTGLWPVRNLAAQQEVSGG